MLAASWKAELAIFILAPPATEAIAASKIADTPAIIRFRIC
jgi:hypothetical protein